MGIFDFAEGPQKLIESSPLGGLCSGSLFPDFRSLFGGDHSSSANMSDAQANASLTSGLGQSIFPSDCPAPNPSPTPQNGGGFFQFSFTTNSLKGFDDALNAIEKIAHDFMGGSPPDASSANMSPQQSLSADGYPVTPMQSNEAVIPGQSQTPDNQTAWNPFEQLTSGPQLSQPSDAQPRVPDEMLPQIPNPMQMLPQIPNPMEMLPPIPGLSDTAGGGGGMNPLSSLDGLLNQGIRMGDTITNIADPLGIVPRPSQVIKTAESLISQPMKIADSLFHIF